MSKSAIPGAPEEDGDEVTVSLEGVYIRRNLQWGVAKRGRGFLRGCIVGFK